MDLNASPTVTAVPLPDEKVSSGPLKTMEEKTPAGQPIVDREKVCELLHVSLTFPHTLFPDGTLSHTRIR